MTVKNRVKEVLDKTGKTRYWLWKVTKLSQNTAYRLCDDPDYIPGGDVLDKICKALDAQPGDLLIYIPADKDR